MNRVRYFMLAIGFLALSGCTGAGALAASAATTAAGAIVKPLFCATLRTSCEFAERTWCEGPMSTEPRTSGGETSPETTTEP